MNPDVTTYINSLNDKPKQEWQVAVCNSLREMVYQVIPDVSELMQYSKPHYKKNGKYVAVISSAKAFVSFTIFNATDLVAPDGFFEASDVIERRTIKIKEGQTIDTALLGKFLGEASETV
jgi:hypothetical protein